ncbi:ComEA family DNA-binding protein [Viscerimonas tarda]
MSATFLYNSFLEKDVIRQQDEAFAEFTTFQNNLTGKQAPTPAEETAAEPESKKTASSASKKLSDGETIELNGSGIATVKRIPGIGDKYAQRIVEYHNQLGGFVSVDQLIEIEGITSARLKKMLPYIQLRKKPKQLKINSLTLQQLSKHPYISDKQAQSIVESRQSKAIKTLEDLQQTPEFTPRDIDRLAGYLLFE